MQEDQQDSAGISHRKLVAGAAVGAGALLGVPASPRPHAVPVLDLGHERGSRASSRRACTAARPASRARSACRCGSTPRKGARISALRAMRKAGTAPDAIVVQTLDFASRGSEGVAEGRALDRRRSSRKPASRSVAVTTPADESRRTRATPRRGNCSFDAVTFAIEEMGDFAEAKLIKPLDAYVAKYKPDVVQSEARLRRRSEHRGPVLEVQQPLLRGRVRQRHAAVLLPQRHDRRPEGAEGLRGQVRAEAPSAGDVGRAAQISAIVTCPTSRCTAT